jgi:hypothetical protein
MDDVVRCGNLECRRPLDDPLNLFQSERIACPQCGSLSRLYSQSLDADHVKVSALLVPLFVGTAVAAVYAGAKIMGLPPRPEPGYHTPHRYGDFVGETFAFGLTVVAVTVAGRMAYCRWSQTFKL